MHVAEYAHQRVVGVRRGTIFGIEATAVDGDLGEWIRVHRERVRIVTRKHEHVEAEAGETEQFDQHVEDASTVAVLEGGTAVVVEDVFQQVQAVACLKRKASTHGV